MAVVIEIAGSDRASKLGPGLGLTGPPPTRVLPFMSQIEAWPVLVFCHRMSSLPAAAASAGTKPLPVISNTVPSSFAPP